MDTSKQYIEMLEPAMKAHPESFANFDTTKNVQDQLQEMIGDYNECIDFLSRVLDPDYMCGEYATYQIQTHLAMGVEASFTSMEQLWLAFVMRENFSKVWNGTDWIEDGTHD